MALLGGATIALVSNLLNLTDLRPGRADKMYLALIGLTAFLWLVPPVLGGTFSLGYTLYGVSRYAVSDFGRVVLLLVPILVVMLPDLREQAMLGDAGANPAGWVAGAFIVTVFPWWGILVCFICAFSLNMASEKVSFSTVIENNPLLNTIDNIGRLKNGDVAGKKDR
jgi:hypothetical protein